MEYRYFKPNRDETRGDKFDFWGTSTWYLEVATDNYVTRQIELYQNGTLLKYDELRNEDHYGGLSEKPIDINEFESHSVSSDEFEALWLRETSFLDK